MEAEVAGYLGELSVLKKQIRDALQGLDDDATNWYPLPKDTNSIYAILSHLIGTDNYWVRQVINGETTKRDRAGEFSASGLLSEVLDQWDKIGKANENVLSQLTSQQLGETREVRSPQGENSRTVRWCILHLISHYAMHLGHIQLTRQLWEQR